MIELAGALVFLPAGTRENRIQWKGGEPPRPSPEGKQNGQLFTVICGTSLPKESLVLYAFLAVFLGVLIR